jgi:adenine-specific DNA-methyltransferase
MPTLHWVGKDKVVNHHHDVPFRLLNREYCFTAKEGTPNNSTNNRIIHGDNLEALKSLLPEFEGKVKCIYIDPPYNTGNEGWVYNDNVNDPKIKKWLGQVVGKEGEDLSRHDKWLCMMYPRLKLLHKLLADDGVIFISIDDNEQATLKLLMDEVFGCSNFLANILWKKKTNGNNMGHIPPVHDFLVCYAKHIALIDFVGFEFEQEFLDKNYSNPDNDPRGLWTTSDLSANHKGPHFKIVNPVTLDEHYPPEGRYWVFNEDEVLNRIESGKIIFGKTGMTKPVQKVFLSEKNQTRKPETWWDKHGFNSDGTKEITEILGAKAFDHSKPSGFIQKIIEFSVGKDAIILDSFAGSGTTAHAVLKLNAADGGNRRFILCEMMDYAETITAERVRRVMDGYGEGSKAVAGLGGGFDYFTVGEPLFLEDRNLNEAIGAAAIRSYVAYTESIPVEQQTDMSHPVSPYTLGVANRALWVFYYERERVTTLDMDFIASLNIKALRDEGKPRPEVLVIYADKCTLDRAFMSRHGIVFKRIPRDITKF